MQWGRLDLQHESNTAFTPDNYTQNYHHPEMDPRGWCAWGLNRHVGMRSMLCAHAPMQQHKQQQQQPPGHVRYVQSLLKTYRRPLSTGPI